MSLILHIDTATETAGVYLALEGMMIAAAVNQQQQDHAKWVHPAIEKLMHDAGYAMQNLKAIAVTAGPGSYTGLRVGMATAKGLCYALSIPLITENTLRLMTAAAITRIHNSSVPQLSLFCPLIDARRMEVFTAIYDGRLEEIVAPSAMILTENSFDQQLASGPVIFFGGGATKWKGICNHQNACFEIVTANGKEFSSLSYTKFMRNEFTSLAYAEPVYLKEFYTHPK